jgi:hypothetical protein
MNIRSVCAAASLALGAAMGLVDSSAGATFVAPGTSNPFLAGMPSGSTCCSGDSAPAESPVYAGPATAGETFTFTDVTGSVSFNGGTPHDPPDGGFRFSSPRNEGGSTSVNNIAGYYVMPVDALLGVFLGPGLPTSNPAPDLLNFRDHGVACFGTQVGTHFATLSPDLQQIFFIGDGLTGTGSGTVQTFIAPTGATRLYLGVADGTQWSNNTGAFDVCVNCGSVVPEFSAASAVPEPSTSAMMLLGFGGIGFWGYLRSEKNRLAVLPA